MTVSANDVLLSVTGLDGGYDQVQILWGVDLEVSAGEMVAIIGSIDIVMGEIDR